MKRRRSLFVFLFTGLLSVYSNCSKNDKAGNENIVSPTVNYWLTYGNQTALLQRQPVALSFDTLSNSYPVITVDSATVFQTIDGFGYTLTGGSAYLINQLDSDIKTSLLQELFGKGENSISISYLRVSIGSSDLNASVFSYDDLPPGQTDNDLRHFSLSKDTIDLIPVLKKILAINPSIKIMGSPWSAPVWMKDNGKSMGGSLQPQYYDVYARYFVKYIQQMQANGIAIDAITPQNEPQHGGNNPSMVMSALQQADFIKNNLGPAFRSAGIKTKIIIWDHNCDNPDYPITVLNDAGAKQFITGSAFHLYGGDISALAKVHAAHPDKQLYFTEQWTGANTSFDTDLRWHIRNVIIGSVRNRSRIALEWNLASDATYNPHTPGGCTECKGALTLGAGIKRNVSYYIIGHIAKFVPPGSLRIESNIAGDVYNAAFLTPDGRKVLVAMNDGTSEANFNIKFNGKWITTHLAAGAAGTYVW